MEISTHNMHILNRIAMLVVANNLDKFDVLKDMLTTNYTKTVADCIKNRDYRNDLARTYIEWARKSSSIPFAKNKKLDKQEKKLLDVCVNYEEEKLVRSLFIRLREKSG